MCRNNVSDLRDKAVPYLLPVLALLTLIVYAPVAWHEFINFDDDVFVYENPHIASGITWKSIVWAFTNAHEVNWIPLTWLSHMLDVQMFGMNPAGHHVVNVLLHTASSCLLFLFLKRSTGRQWQSAAVAFLFALHPLHVESVAWVAERKDVLSAFFGMLSLYSYVLYVEKPVPARYGASLLFFVLGLLSKPMLVTLPVILLLLDRWPLERFSVRGENGRTSITRLLLEKLPFLVLATGTSYITYLVQHAAEFNQGYTLLSRAGKSCIAYVTYLIKMVWPVNLAVLYPFPKYPPGTMQIFLSVIALLAITVACIWFRKRYPYLLTGWSWYIVTLLPVIGLIQIGQHSSADRYTYIPLVGIFMIISWGLPDMIKTRCNGDVILTCLGGLCLAGMIVSTSLQLRYWRNNYTLYTHTLAVTEQNWVIHNNLGIVYLNEGNVALAIQQFKKALSAKPSYTYAHMNLGAAYQALNQLDAAQDAYTLALQFDPDNPNIHFALGNISLLRGDISKAQAAYHYLRQTASPLAGELLQLITTHHMDSPKIP